MSIPPHTRGTPPSDAGEPLAGRLGASGETDWGRIHKLYMHSIGHDVYDLECLWEDIHLALPEIVTDLNNLPETLLKENE